VNKIKAFLPAVHSPEQQCADDLLHPQVPMTDPEKLDTVLDIASQEGKFIREIVIFLM
jgi:hypothetical protein